MREVQVQGHAQRRAARDYSPVRWGAPPAARPSTAASTSATPAPSSSSPSSPASCTPRATRAKLVVNVTDVNDKIYAAATAAGEASAEFAARMTARRRRGHRQARPRPPRRGAAGLGDDRRGRRPDRERSRAVTPTSPAATSTSLGVASRTYGRPSNRLARGHGRGRGGGVGLAEGGSRSTSRSGRRTRRARTPAGTHPGSRPAGLAHRVLGDGRAGARRFLRDPRRRLRTSSSPHHENEIAQSEAAGRPFARAWMHNGMVEAGAEKMSKSDGNIFQLWEALDRYGREAVVAYLISGHYRQPLAFGDEQMRAGAWRRSSGCGTSFARTRVAGGAGEGSPEQQRGGSGEPSPAPRPQPGSRLPGCARG